MPSPISKPLFNVPLGLAPTDSLLLERTRLLPLYELNKQDFIDVVAAIYFDRTHLPDPGALADPEKGFDSFCKLLTAYFTAAPTQTSAKSINEKGEVVNFFGDAISHHLESPNLSMQTLYAHDGSEKHALVWRAIDVFVEYLAIQAFSNNIASLQLPDIKWARARIRQLMEGTRKLRVVAQKSDSPKPFFHSEKPKK